MSFATGVLARSIHRQSTDSLNNDYWSSNTFSVKLQYKTEERFLRRNGKSLISQSGLSVYSVCEHAFLKLGCQETTTNTSLSLCSSSAVHSLNSYTFTGAECCSILDAYVPGCIYASIKKHFLNVERYRDGCAKYHRN